MAAETEFVTDYDDSSICQVFIITGMLVIHCDTLRLGEDAHTNGSSAKCLRLVLVANVLIIIISQLIGQQC